MTEQEIIKTNNETISECLELAKSYSSLADEYNELNTKINGLRSSLLCSIQSLTLSSTSATQFSFSTRIGSGSQITLSSDSKSFVIGKGISMVEIVAQPWFQKDNAGTKVIGFYKNGSLANSGYIYLSGTTNYIIARSSTIIDVVEGDTISVYISGASGDIINPDGRTSYVYCNAVG
jgi:hypothetical protein